MHAARQCSDLFIMAYMFQQQFAIDWLSTFYVHQSDFATTHKRLMETTKWNRPRRPIVFMCLGHWCIWTNNRTFYQVDDALDAFALWLAILHVDFNDTLESGKKIKWIEPF